MNVFINLRLADTSDSELIRICAEHIANRDAFNEAGLDSDGAGRALWQAYMQTYNAISDAKPQTLEGIVAKARATKEEATNLDGTVQPEDATEWAWDLVEDLVRLGDSGR